MTPSPANASDPSARRDGLDRRLSVAPMMEWTDRHFRSLVRLIAPDALVYTEMVVDQAVLHGDRDRLLGFEAREKPVALQLGGSDPARLAEAGAIGAALGYDEINLNIGCPSGRVQAGRFGACLMAEPGLVADCVRALRAAVDVPVTVKTRIGIDEQDSYEFLAAFVDEVAGAGADAVIVHARKAWLSGLSPKQNREIPPLDYARVRRLRRAVRPLPVVVNGGVDDAEAFAGHLRDFDGVMIGRAAYQNPMTLAAMQRVLDPGYKVPSRAEVIRRYLPYIERQLARGVRLHDITRHMMGLYAGRPGARSWRRGLSAVNAQPNPGTDYIESIMATMAAAA